MTPRLTSADLLYEPLIAQYLGPGFVEREWLVSRVEQHFADPDCRFVLLSGGPGTGKSAFLAWLSRRHALSPRYFLRRLSSHPLASGDASSLLLSIGHQLAVLRPDMMRADLDVQVEQTVGQVAAGGHVVGVRVGVLHISPFQRTAVQVEQQADHVEGTVVGFEIERMIVDPRLNDLGTLQNLALLEPAIRLAAQDPTGLVVVLIDAVDELRYQFAGRGDILQWLAECPELPANLRIVVSCRPDRQLLHRFRLAQADRLREETIEPSAAEVTADLIVYAESVLDDPALAGVRRMSTRRLAEHARGSFLYLVLWARGLRDAVNDGDETRIAALTDLSVLPTGLDGIYEYFLTLVRDAVRQREGRAWTRAWKYVYRPLLAVLAVAQAPLSERHLLLLADLERPDLAEALTDLEQFLIEDQNGIRLYHLTVAEFLADPRRNRDDWFVDAEESHQRIAERLIDEHGAAWSACEDEYALTHTVTHLVAAGSTGPLTGLLSAPEFGVAKAHKIGVDAMLLDYVAANAALPDNAELAAGLTKTLAQLVNEGVPNVADTLQAVVSYRRDAAELNERVLNRLSDPAYLEQSIENTTSRAAALIAFSQGQATRLRRAGDLDEARRILVQAVSGEDITSVTSAKQRSTLCYELGYLDFLYGDTEQARDWFRRSIEAAEEAGERTSAYISRLVNARVGLLNGSVPAEEYLATVEEASAYFSDPDVAGPHVARWLMAVQGYLLDLALWTENTELIATQLRVLAEDSWIQQTGRHDIVQKHRARAAAITGDWAESIALFEALLAEAPPHQEELARELYYYGRALLGSGDAAEAREVWERGLRTPDNAANWPWKPKISTSIAQL
ncbi:tetratricopeptide (TPR) repeat protein [Kibdelosporangium banguiense]|uniref:Tetratricopeptide (TPR) repeat protein n=1 Tax=Kibdelosporangium banguiense TaxID=1365924 RepID=A0ABS4TQC3_9PSEU|nr:hypothetical protein [Kibdelosporangium banguiense]MBP2326616.1 tetratricopeptide (TPR) repeat protein [Kibdelosporangium banguiense]